MITTEHLEQAMAALRYADEEAGIGRNEQDAANAINAELHRRKHGPFMLAEAVASGRPFKRGCWAYWVPWCVGIISGEKGLLFVMDNSALILVTTSDLTAVDCVLKLEGGE